jgi:hypothetical protein
VGIIFDQKWLTGIQTFEQVPFNIKLELQRFSLVWHEVSFNPGISNNINRNFVVYPQWS